ncbi:MAG: type II secretion system protein GspL [Cocleimonas sp.]
MQLLVIKINALHANPEYALLGKKQAEDRFTPGDWDKVRSLAKGRRVVALLPNSDVVLTRINVPSKNKKQLHQAIPYALEDSLADDIDDLHFAIHQKAIMEDSNVAVINRDHLDLVISLLRKKGVTAHFIFPQLLAQTRADKSWSILEQAPDLNGNQAITIRNDDFSGFSCDKNLLDLFVTEQLEKSEPESISSNMDADALPKALQSLPLTKIDLAVVQYRSIERALPLNLLTGFISKKRESTINWKAWRMPMVLGSFVAATWLGIIGWQNNALQKKNNHLNQSIETLFTSTFPGSRVVDAPQQMRSKLAALKKGTGATVSSPLPLIADISPLLKEYKDLTLKEIRYQENELILVMQAPNLTRLETFKKDAAEKSNLKISIKSSTTTANKVESLLIISPLASVNTRNAGENS